MKPHVLITRPVSPEAVELLASVCDTLPRIDLGRRDRGEFDLVAGCTDAILMGTPERIDATLMLRFPQLRVIACTFRLPEHIDITACTRRGVWVTNVTARWPSREAELEAARNILDVLGGDTPRGAMNDVLQTAA
jgi:phosphonate dehydrogenase